MSLHSIAGLIEFFRRHLAREVERDMGVACQIMVAPDNLDETVWPDGQSLFGVAEAEQNREAAVRYLHECAS